MKTAYFQSEEHRRCQMRKTTRVDASSGRLETQDRVHVEAIAGPISRNYEDLFYRSDTGSRLTRIREALEARQSLEFSDRYSGKVIPLIQEIVAWEMLNCDYFPGPGDRIDFEVFETLPVGQLNLMFATGLTDTSCISNPKIFVREDILRSSEHNAASILRGSDTYAEEIRHSIDALWRNRIRYLTSSQQAMLNAGKLDLPMDWSAQGYFAGPFVTQILGESGAHLMDYVRYGHDRYGEVSDYNWDYFVDPIVRYGSITLCQVDAHRPAQVLDRVIRQKLEQWTPSRKLRPALARRINQYLILSVPERKRPVSVSTLRSWQELHDLPYVVGGLLDQGLAPSSFRTEVLRARVLLRKLHERLISDGLRVENREPYEKTIALLERVSKELATRETRLEWDYVLKVKQSLWHSLRYAGRELNKGSAFQAQVEEIDALGDLESFYAALFGKIRAAVSNFLRTNPADREAWRLLRGLSRQIMTEAHEMSLHLTFDRLISRAEARDQTSAETSDGNLAA